MTRTLFADAAARNATCNDGSAAGYYVWQPAAPSTKWLIYLQGGGLCYDLETCLTRPKVLTSSTTWPEHISVSGIFSTGDGNRFADFNKVFVGYCTSDLYSGTVAQGSGMLGWSFHGHYIVPSVLQDLKASHPGFGGGTELLFTGGSAGGIGTFVNYPMVKEAVSWMPVKALPDAGWFLTTMKPYSSKAAPIPKLLQEGMPAWRGVPPARCAAALGAKAWMCYSGPVVYPFMPAPLSDLMVLKAQTDAWTVGHDGVKMPPDAAELVWLTELAAETRATFVLDKVANVFSANCLYHTSLVGLWGALRVNGTLLGTAVQKWYFDGSQTHLVDSCTTPLCNKSCL